MSLFRFWHTRGLVLIAKVSPIVQNPKCEFISDLFNRFDRYLTILYCYTNDGLRGTVIVYAPAVLPEYRDQTKLLCGLQIFHNMNVF